MGRLGSHVTAENSVKNLDSAEIGVRASLLSQGAVTPNLDRLQGMRVI